jgi:cyclopropane fatty-acyl-phospholipid synthase-like methyltransferase
MLPPALFPAGSRKNIEEHYDAGNAMYATFLDDSMTYSAGIHTQVRGSTHRLAGPNMAVCSLSLSGAEALLLLYSFLS